MNFHLFTDNKDKLMWQPGKLKANQVENYLSIWQGNGVHVHDDEQALDDADKHSLHQHAKGGVLPRDGQEPEDYDGVAKGDGLFLKILKSMTYDIQYWLA